MSAQFPYLDDRDFLFEFDRQKQKEQIVKIILLDNEEREIEEITGRAVSGSLNLNGDSSLRRTGNISVFLDNSDIDYTAITSKISINKKIKLLIGFKNTTVKYIDFPVLWFPQGVFVVQSPSISFSNSGINISLTLKDKMCLLNGECGGTLPATVIFSEREDYDTETDSWYITKPTIYQIIYEIVNHWGGIQLGKIIISGVPLKIKQVMKWTGQEPLYISKAAEEVSSNTQIQVSLSPFKEKGRSAKAYSTGSDVGYIYTDFVYPGELAGQAGETVCTILDKIKNTLGHFEYFFDIEGNFIFQEIPDYLNTTKATTDLSHMENSNYIVDMKQGSSIYDFSDGQLVLSYNNNPDYSNIKNDFLVWGVRKTVTGQELPFRYHLAIDDKPEYDNQICRLFFYQDEYNNNMAKIPSNLEEEALAQEITIDDWRTALYIQGLLSIKNGTESNYYYTELANEWLKLYNLKDEYESDYTEEGYLVFSANTKLIAKKGFKSEVIESPQSLDYFLDFIDSESALGQYKISNIGRRTKVINDSSINCMFEPIIPDVCYVKINSETFNDEIQLLRDKHLNYAQLPSDIYDLLQVGGTYNSAYTMIKDLLYQYTNYNESISIGILPIYHIEPNSRITVNNTISNISGDYIIKTISMPLVASSTMNISANKAVEKI